MPDQPDTPEAVLLARLAGIVVPEERLEPLRNGMSIARTATRLLRRYDYGLLEPASRFRPPGSR